MTTWSKSTKSGAPWSKVSKSLGTNSFLLLENGGHVLLENGGKIILEQSNPSTISWTKLNKS